MTAALAITQTELAPDVHTFDGRRLRVEVWTETLIDVQRGASTGAIVRSRLIDLEDGKALSPNMRSALLGSDIERADLVALRRARHSAPASAGLLMVEVSFVTASSQRARSGLAEAAALLRNTAGGALVWLMTDIPDGAGGRLSEPLTVLRAMGRAVFGEIRAPNAARSLKGSGLTGLVLAAPAGLNETDAALWLLSAGRGVEAAAPLPRIASGAPKAELAGIAAAAGFTHISVPQA